jgi:Icc protein
MLLWGTDFHFNFLKPKGFYSPVTRFGEYLMEENPDADGIVITGDISTGKLLTQHLKEFALGFTKQIYFVLGNHCYYGSSFAAIDALVRKVVKEVPNLHFLNDGFHEVEGHLLVGVGGWYDAYYGNPKSNIELNDFYDIRELLPGSRYREILLGVIRERAGNEADRLAFMLKEACEKPNDVVIVATHVAPYEGAAWHMGKPSDRDWQPWFSSASTGAVLDTYADKHPEKTFIVLCGHSHSPGVYQRRGNMMVYTGRARYSFPDLCGVIYTKEGKLWAYGPTGEKVECRYRPDGVLGK